MKINKQTNKINLKRDKINDLNQSKQVHNDINHTFLKA